MTRAHKRGVNIHSHHGSLIWATGFSISRACVIQLPIFGAEAIPVTPRGVDLVDRGVASSRKDAKA